MDLRTYEPDLYDMLDDPVIQEMMRSDGIKRRDLELLVKIVRGRTETSNVF